MATQEIVQSFSYVSWALLVGLALGSFGLAYLLRQTTDATTGFVGTTALVAALLAALGFATDTGLPVPDQLAIVTHPELDAPRRVLLAAFAILAAWSGLGALRGGRARWVGAAAVVAGVGTLLAASLGWQDPGVVDGLPLFVQLVSLSAVAGGSLGAVILAHWYLVTPRISEQPLVLTTKLLCVAIAIQLLLFLVWLAVGYPGQPPFAALTGSQALFVWLRLIVGILFPLLLAWMSWKTAVTRSMESATGLLYIELALVLASTIVGAGLAFSVGLLV
ncbi:MAG: hypothetical protein U0667_13225 [Chloroflexota bacterium]